ncbi:MAG: hypothetical protein K6A65_00325 [Succinivibrionaceae bacterium]|nr:hypothetical protein [Succinivibrionaceae bacterium]
MAGKVGGRLGRAPLRDNPFAEQTDLREGPFAGNDLNTALLSARPSTFMFTMSSDAMRGSGILNGDILICRRDLLPREGDIIIAEWRGEFWVRQWVTRPTPRLIASDGVSPDILLDDLNAAGCFGVVSGVVRRLKCRPGNFTARRPPPRH